ncbi:hypothetical protein L1267_20375 [Pseudoalteromonas sp. OFAV1]|jgi:hypothetical protein|uniref:hypothetical protein n=1 Tax=Pseudoalteromonas sp. OFAV1 TaxID=2908892 RepID=UPI001F3A2FD9|nr:hypothetical protein [Pseudoalteromonas sp. OFAV1]MCF2902730.1 hypothetical protein [Pseudoalteromonas sp. OFAV1]
MKTKLILGLMLAASAAFSVNAQNNEMAQEQVKESVAVEEVKAAEMEQGREVKKEAYMKVQTLPARLTREQRKQLFMKDMQLSEDQYKQLKAVQEKYRNEVKAYAKTLQEQMSTELKSFLSEDQVNKLLSKRHPTRIR